MRLDRVLINGSSIAMLPTLKVEHLARVASDHTPLLIILGDSIRKLAPFKYIRAWHDHADFITSVERTWSGHAHANPILAFALKLQRLRRHLKSWNWTVFGNVKLRITTLTGKVEELEKEVQRQWNPSTESLLRSTREELAQVQRQHFQILADKAKAQWVAEGDRNITLFHAMIKWRRARNTVQIETADGSHTNDRQVIGTMAQGYFQSILGSFSVCPLPDALTHITPIITDADNDTLSSMPSGDEIFNAIQRLNPSSAPGPDGFTGHFYVHCWHIIKKDLINAVHAFFRGQQLPSAITATNLVLIPKKHVVTSVEQLRPISLCNFIHKVISSLLNSRLASTLPRIISQEQCGIMPGRNMMDSIALAHDLTCHINKGRRGGNVIIKVDMSKAYDRVSWLFLLHMLRALGFNSKWCDLIYRSIANCWYSVLWDGSAFGHFKSNPGVRQGDPLSHSLFIICMEAFSQMMKQSLPSNRIDPYFVSMGALQVSHLLYADDMLIFTNGTQQSLGRLMAIINQFCTNSGQLLNHSKCTIFFDQLFTDERRLSALRLTGFTQGAFPTTYLGAPLFPGRVKIEYF
ncbi:unnamed protein product [Rhodiola kirilowii]